MQTWLSISFLIPKNPPPFIFTFILYICWLIIEISLQVKNKPLLSNIINLSYWDLLMDLWKTGWVTMASCAKSTTLPQWSSGSYRKLSDKITEPPTYQSHWALMKQAQINPIQSIQTDRLDPDIQRLHKQISRDSTNRNAQILWQHNLRLHPFHHKCHTCTYGDTAKKCYPQKWLNLCPCLSLTPRWFFFLTFSLTHLSTLLNIFPQLSFCLILLSPTPGVIFRLCMQRPIPVSVSHQPLLTAATVLTLGRVGYLAYEVIDEFYPFIHYWRQRSKPLHSGITVTGRQTRQR